MHANYHVSLMMKCNCTLYFIGHRDMNARDPWVAFTHSSLSCKVSSVSHIDAWDSSVIDEWMI